MANHAEDRVRDVEWARVLGHLESRGLRVHELASLYTEGRWAQARVCIEGLDDESVKTGFRTVGDILYLEHTEGVDVCSAKIEEMMSAPDVPPARVRTLGVMRAYVDGKLGMRTADVLVTVALVALVCSGVDINIHAPNQAGRLAFEVLVAAREAIKQSQFLEGTDPGDGVEAAHELPGAAVQEDRDEDGSQ